MPCVTLLLTGFPRYVPLEDLSHHLDLLFDTDEIGTFKLRNLPNHPRTNKRQIALDFCSGFDAMAAQEKLDIYNEYEYKGGMYLLYAKINKIKEYARDSFSPVSTGEDRNLGWPALGTIPDVSFGDMYRAHAKLDAHLELLKKKKLILKTQREILRERRRLKREYGCMEGHDSEPEATPSKHHRPRSRGCRSGSRRRRSRSREGHVVHGSKDRRSRSTEHSRPYNVKNEHYKTRQLRSRSKERRSLSRETRARDFRSRPRDPRNLRPLIRGHRDRSKSQDRKSDSNEKIYLRRPYKDPRPISRGVHRYQRTVSRERTYADQRRLSRERDRESISRSRRSTSRSRYIERRSGERVVQIARSCDRRSESRYRKRVDDFTALSSINWNYGDQRSRTPARRTPLAIMPNSEQSDAPRDWSQRTANEPPMIDMKIFRNKHSNVTNTNSHIVKNKQAASAPKENSTDFNRNNKMGNETEKNTKNQKEDQDNILANSKIRKEELLKLKIESITQNVKLLVLSTLYEIILEDNIMISRSNKILWEKTLEELVRERVKPLVRERKEGDIGVVMRKYKLQYPKENEILLIREVLQDIPKTNVAPADDMPVIISEGHTATPSIQREPYLVNSGLEVTGSANPGPTGSGSENHGLDNPTGPCNPGSPKNVPVSGPTNLGATELRPNPRLRNPAPVNSGLSNLGTTKVPTNPWACIWDIVLRAANPGSANLGSNAVRPASGTSKLVTTTPDSSKLQAVIPGCANLGTTAVRASSGTTKLVTAARDTSKLRAVNAGSANLGSTAVRLASGTAKLVAATLDSSKLREVNPGCANLGSTAVRPASGTSKLVTADPDTSKLQAVNPGCANLGSTAVRPASGTSKLITAAPGTSELQAVNPDCANLGSTAVRLASGTSKLITSAPDTSKLQAVNPGCANLGSTAARPTSGTSKPVTAAPNTSKLRAVNPGCADLGSTAVRPVSGTSKLIKDALDTSKLSKVNPGCADLGSIAARPASGTSKLVTAAPNTSKLSIVNPGSANLSSTAARPASGTSKLVIAAPVTSKLQAVNPGCSNLGSTAVRPASATSKLVTATPDTSKLSIVNPGSANLSSTAARPASGTSKLVAAARDTSKLWPVKPGLANIGSTAVRPVSGTSELVSTSLRRPATSDASNLRPVYSGPVELEPNPVPVRPVSLRPTEFTPALATSKIQQVDPGLATDIVKTVSQTTMKANAATTDIVANTDECKANENDTKAEKDDTENSNKSGDGTERNVENNSNSLKVTAITILTSLNELAAITDKTIEPSMEVPMENVKEEIPLENSDKEPTDPSLQPETDRPCPVTSTTQSVNAENAKHNGNKAIDGTEDNSNLKVTAITIVTSLNELTEITDRPQMEIPIKDIKEEIIFENSEETDPSLKVGHVPTLTKMHNAENAKNNSVKAIERNEENSSNNLKVTAITIMTSLTELTAIADKTTDRSKIQVSSEEIKEELFENSDTEEIDSAPKNTEEANNHQVSSICGKRVVQQNCNYSELPTNKKAKRSQGETTLDDEDETIESIGKYVQSLLKQAKTQ